ncbi:ankyrin-3-like [Hippocampus comes]|uniref:ankyrin-3-like n=1 Tax=Hippocampus comes TaxID=109280 RepID=UPI00094E4BE8|nr:PREDICTED: ankyrin-3-like [Hippocampus comes]
MDEELDSQEELQKKRICRIITRDLPQYFAVVSRVRQDSILIGPEGGVLNSTVVPQVQAVFPEGALTKRIRVGLQVNDIALELHMCETSRMVHENMLLQRTLGWRVVAWWPMQPPVHLLECFGIPGVTKVSCFWS